MQEIPGGRMTDTRIIESILSRNSLVMLVLSTGCRWQCPIRKPSMEVAFLPGFAHSDRRSAVLRLTWIFN